MGIDILLESETYLPGQQIIGQVKVTSQKKKKIKGVKVEVNGVAKLEWLETVIKHTIYYKAHEEYLECSLNLIGKVELLPGAYLFGFSFMLPTNLPSSFEGKWGSVRYIITAEIDYSFGQIEKEEKQINIKSPLDLTLHREYASPYTFRKEKKYCSLCCISGSLSVAIQIPAKAFLPGQPIFFSVECNNLSNVKIKRLSLKLVRQITYHSQKPIIKVKMDYVTIGELSFQSISTGECKSWRRKLDIPVDILTYLKPCKIIKFNYLIVIEAKINGCRSSYFYGEMPIILGNSGLETVVRKLT